MFFLRFCSGGVKIILNQIMPKASGMWQWKNLVFQEDDIPELEIDIDELLELSDCEQRIKLQVV